ncbi:MAG: fibro-slime domain-containing protein [Phycisphaerales bacterium JB043]
MRPRPDQRIQLSKSLLLSASVFSIALLNPIGTPTSLAVVKDPDVVMIPAVVRDFNETHPDFGVTDSSEHGHYTRLVGPQLDLEGRPMFTGFGVEVAQQWYDKDGNPIAPYGDLGLFGGHFDVTFWDRSGTTDYRFHQHMYDDMYDVTYVDLINDHILEFNDIIGPSYPNDIRVEMVNQHNHGGGWVTFEAGGVREMEYTSRWKDRTFSPSQLTEFRIDFMSFDDMLASTPWDVWQDPINRNDSWMLRFYDDKTNKLVYEINVYYHYKESDGPLDIPVPAAVSGVDNCGVAYNDSPGLYGTAGKGGVTDVNTFHQWFADIPGVNVSGLARVPLTRNGAGVYEHISDDFFPIDGQLLGNDLSEHNELFTMHMSMAFEYNKCTDMFFELESNDDAWVFINGELALDIGGLATPSKQYVAIDRLKLIDGEVYTIDIFYARRRQAPTSVFNLRTNINFLIGEMPTTSALWD